MADAAYAILNRDSRTATGNFYIDEAVLREEGVTDFDRYAVTPGGRLHTRPVPRLNEKKHVKGEVMVIGDSDPRQVTVAVTCAIGSRVTLHPEEETMALASHLIPAAPRLRSMDCSASA